MLIHPYPLLAIELNRIENIQYNDLSLNSNLTHTY